MPSTIDVLITAFAIFQFVQELQGQDQFSCREVVFNCDCGIPGYVFQAYFKQCHYWLPPEQACTRYANCLECESGIDSCISCPLNRYGRQCRGVCKCTDGQTCNRDTGQCERSGSPKPPSVVTASPPPSTVSCALPEVMPPVQQRVIEEQGVLKAVEYSCPNPYTLIGTRRITCNNGIWDNNPPRCDSCTPPVIQPPLQQKMVLSEQGVPKTIEYSCPVYHVLEGPEKITCNDGKWDATPPTCRPSGCTRPGEISNGRIDRFFLPDGTTIGSGSGGGTQIFQVGTIAVYECNPFYKLAGTRGRKRCLDTGEWTGDDPKCIIDCGVSEFKAPNIINGTITEPGNWPWQAGLADFNNFIFCGGSLITEIWVLTAAHCLWNARERRRRHTSEMKVFLGKYRRSVKDEHVQERSVIHYEEHPRFTDTTYDNDIALLLLDISVVLTRRTLPVCLPTEARSHLNVDVGRKGLVTGWGRTEEGKISDVLKRTYLTVISNNECSMRNSQGQSIFIVTANMFCAGVPRGASDVCEGDSGGPMVFKGTDDNRWYIEGIVSWGANETCAVDGMYSGFTRVSRYLDWINGQLLRSPFAPRRSLVLRMRKNGS